MKKIVNPCLCDVGTLNRARAYAKIEIHDGKLSICGVVGSLANGDCLGGAGQCVDEIRRGEPAEGWTREMLNKFCDIWDRWHLNDMRPYCEHQKELGWDKIAREEVTLYHYTLTPEAIKKQNEAKNVALTALKEGRTFTPTPEQVQFVRLPYEVTTPEEWNDSNYKPRKRLYPSDRGATETKMLGWLRPDEHPRGILGKACPVCGYRYGSAWLKEELPQDVIDFLVSLPTSKYQPAWV